MGCRMRWIHLLLSSHTHTASRAHQWSPCRYMYVHIICKGQTGVTRRQLSGQACARPSPLLTLDWPAYFTMLDLWTWHSTWLTWAYISKCDDLSSQDCCLLSRRHSARPMMTDMRIFLVTLNGTLWTGGYYVIKYVTVHLVHSEHWSSRVPIVRSPEGLSSWHDDYVVIYVS